MFSLKDLNLPRPAPGEDLKYSPIYTQIKDARFEEEDYLSMGIWERELKKADWGTVERLCQEALSEKTIDLQIACWLCESWCHLYQWEGVQHSLSFFEDFLRACWTVCFPKIDEPNPEEENEHRILILEWFSDKMRDAILFIPLNKLSGLIEQEISMADWLSALNLDSVLRRSGGNDAKTKELENTGTMTLKRFRSLMTQIPQQKLSLIDQAAITGLQHLQNCEDFLKQIYPDQYPSFTSLRTILEDLHKLCPKPKDSSLDSQPGLGQNKEKEDSRQAQNSAGPDTETSTTNQSQSDNSQNPVQISDQNSDLDLSADTQEVPSDSESEAATDNEEVSISSKNDAYKALGDLADYLIEIDAQNPAPYLVKLAASWHEKSLPEILDDAASGQTNGHRILKMFTEIVNMKRNASNGG